MIKHRKSRNATTEVLVKADRSELEIEALKVILAERLRVAQELTGEVG